MRKLSIPIRFKVLFLTIVFLLTYCSTSEESLKNDTISIKDLQVKASLEKIEELTFESVNNSWEKIIDGDKPGSMNKVETDNYPNPFSPPFYPTTNISMTIVNPDSFKISLLDKDGKNILLLFNDYLLTGLYRMRFSDIKLNSDLYFVLLENKKEKFLRKILFVKELLNNY